MLTTHLSTVTAHPVPLLEEAEKLLSDASHEDILDSLLRVDVPLSEATPGSAPDSGSPNLPPLLEPPTLWERFCQKQVLKNFEKSFIYGQLQVILPTGETVLWGNPDPEAPGVRASMVVHHPRLFTQVVLFGDIGFAETYMSGDWDTPDLAAVITWFIDNVAQSQRLDRSVNRVKAMNWLGVLNRVMHWLKPNSLNNSQRNIQEHYDLSNEFFELMLDETMCYSSARFRYPDQPLLDAQLEKMEALCQKLRLKPGDKVLEIGSGWGALACYMAKRYGCSVHTITLSPAQLRVVLQRVEEAGLQDKVTAELKDYRELLVQNPLPQYDKIVSVEMIEAVGEAYMDTYLQTCSSLLAPNGLLALQLITCPDDRYHLLQQGVDFIQKHIFPGSLLPSMGRVMTGLSRVSEMTMTLFELEDMGLSYARTLHLWHQRFNEHITEVRALSFDERFIRKWNYYLKYCEAAFATRNITVGQAVFTRSNNECLKAG